MAMMRKTGGLMPRPPRKTGSGGRILPQQPSANAGSRYRPVSRSNFGGWMDNFGANTDYTALINPAPPGSGRTLPGQPDPPPPGYGGRTLPGQTDLGPPVRQTFGGGNPSGRVALGSSRRGGHPAPNTGGGHPAPNTKPEPVVFGNQNPTRDNNGNIPYGNDAVTPHPNGGYVPTNTVPTKDVNGHPTPDFENTPNAGGGSTPSIKEGNTLANWIQENAMQKVYDIWAQGGEITNPQPWAGSVVPDFSGDSQDVMSRYRDWGLRGSGATNRAEKTLGETLDSQSMYNDALGYNKAGMSARDQMEMTARGGQHHYNPLGYTQFGNVSEQALTSNMRGAAGGLEALNMTQGGQRTKNVQDIIQSGNEIWNDPLLQTAGGQAARNNQLSNIYGENLNGNPYLDAMYDKAAGKVSKSFKDSIRPGIDSQASMMGRYGSGSHDRLVDNARTTLGETLGNLATDIYAGNYQQERGRQQQSALASQNMYANTYEQARGRQATMTNNAANRYTNAYENVLNRQTDAAKYSSGLSSNFASGNLSRQQQASEKLADIYSGSYGQERTNQMRALAMAPQIRGMRDADLQRMLQSGRAIEQQDSSRWQEEKARYEMRRDSPWIGINRYADQIAKLGGGRATGPMGTQDQTYDPGGFNWGGAIGGAAAGYGGAALMAGGLANAWNPVGWGMLGVGALSGSGLFG